MPYKFVEVTGGSLTIGGTALANAEIKTATLTQGVTEREVRTWASYPDPTILVLGKTNSLSVVYSQTDDAAPIQPGVEGALVLTLPNTGGTSGKGLKISGNIVVTGSTTSMGVDNEVEVTLEMRFTGACTVSNVTT